MNDIENSVLEMKGVGPKRAEQLATLGITTIKDLLFYFPFRFEDFEVRSLDEALDQEKIVIKGLVLTEPVVSYFGRRRNRLAFRIRQGEDVAQVVFFNQGYLKTQIAPGSEILLFGKWDSNKQQLLGIKVLQQRALNSFEPVYHVNKHLQQRTLIPLIRQAFEMFGSRIEEVLPERLLEHFHLMERKKAVHALHFPASHHEYQAARQRMVFEEFFLFEMQMMSLNHPRNLPPGKVLKFDNQKLKALIQTLPFELTAAQKRVTNEICRDLLEKQPMQRLLQGDVGSGKTLVAALGLYAAVTAGAQGALMVPTEILARQHAASLAELFQPTGLVLALLTSSTKPGERQAILAGLAAGTIDIIVGTHALIQEDVEFKNLGLVIVDEQHRFGVNQRKALRAKGHSPNLLFMTATPIPRTLAITTYGEMKVSVIDELPQGRQPIQTFWLSHKQWSAALRSLTAEIAEGHQMYVVCPLIGESEMMDLKNAEETFHELEQTYPQFTIGLLHGQLKNEEKERIMEAFKKGKLQILVSTTVIEVGVDVPNATVMMVMDADRFGLAQLHQLRGRVGRGKAASKCILIADPKSEMGKRRMKLMTEISDGFALSEQDLVLRGPGEVFGARQSGVPNFALGDLVRDEKILQAAHGCALKIWQLADWEQQPEFAALKRELAARALDGYFD
ncbi:MAG: ATP-dependent DNA helicase RecG [Enterococcaceae bacterium]|nr:ATP-dependent DNA helicase RecG [Enterococcaceae bacterium]MCI1919640.1 ATP-dependent DNA helicase RecG [Enterococcaceae bacterium]